MAKTGSRRTPLSAFVLFLLPLIGVFSSYYGNRELLLAIFLAVGATMFAFVVRQFGKSPDDKDRVYLILIFSISLTLLLCQSLASGNLLGWDIHQEYSLFLQVSKEGVWHPNIDIPYNSVLSVTIFPTILNVVSGLDGAAIFKIVFPLIYSVAPVVLYRLYRKILPPEASFLAVFLFVAYKTSYVELITLAREELAEVLLLLLLLLFFSTKIQGRSRFILILMLTIGIVTAHYSIAYVYLLVLSFTLFSNYFFRGKTSELANPSLLILTASITLGWYTFVTGGSNVAGLVDFLLSIPFGDFFSLLARPAVVSQALGVDVLPGLLHLLNRMTYYALNLVLALGFLAFLLKRQKVDPERKMMPLMTSGMFLIGCAIVLPNFAFGLNFSRIYHIALLLVSPCLLYGAEMLSLRMEQLFLMIRGVSLRAPVPVFAGKGRILAATILFSFLLFDSGWVWAVSMDRPTSFLLDSQRMLTYPEPSLRADLLTYYTAAEDIAGARWLRPQLSSGLSLCSDFWSRYNVLTSYGEISRGSDLVPTYFLPDECDFHGAYVYLSVLNTVYGIGTRFSLTPENRTWQISDISAELFSGNIIYSNGGTKVYFYSPYQE